jgi:hypothetical protein
MSQAQERLKASAIRSENIPIALYFQMHVMRNFPSIRPLTDFQRAVRSENEI